MLLGLAVSTSHQFIEISKWKEEAWHLAKEAEGQADVMTDLARAFVQFGDPRAYIDFWELLNSGKREQTLEQQKALGLTAHEQALVGHAFEEAEHLALTEEIAMRLTIQASLPSPDLRCPSPPLTPSPPFCLCAGLSPSLGRERARAQTHRREGEHSGKRKTWKIARPPLQHKPRAEDWGVV